MNRKLKKQYQKRAAAAFRKRCFNHDEFVTLYGWHWKVWKKLKMFWVTDLGLARRVQWKNRVNKSNCINPHPALY